MFRDPTPLCGPVSTAISPAEAGSWTTLQLLSFFTRPGGGRKMGVPEPCNTMVRGHRLWGQKILGLSLNSTSYLQCLEQVS